MFFLTKSLERARVNIQQSISLETSFEETEKKAFLPLGKSAAQTTTTQRQPRYIRHIYSFVGETTLFKTLLGVMDELGY